MDRIPDELARWMSASDGKLELTTDEVRSAGKEILELRSMSDGLRAWRAEVDAAAFDDGWIIAERIDQLLGPRGDVCGLPVLGGTCGLRYGHDVGPCRMASGCPDR